MDFCFGAAGITGRLRAPSDTGKIMRQARPLFVSLFSVFSALSGTPSAADDGCDPCSANYVGDPTQKTQLFHDGLGAVALENRWGFVDRNGRLAIAPQFTSVTEFREGRAGAGAIEGREGYIDTKGQWIIEPKFAAVYPYRGGIALVREEHNARYIDRDGRTVFGPRPEFIFESRACATDSALPVRHKKKYLRLNASGRVQTTYAPYRNEEALYDYPLGMLPDNAHEDRIPAHSGHGHANSGYVNYAGEWLVPATLRTTEPYYGGYAVAQDAEEHYGILDRDGQWALPPRFRYIQRSDDFYLVKDTAESAAGTTERQRKGYFDRAGRFVFLPQGAESLGNNLNFITGDAGNDLVDGRGHSLLRDLWEGEIGKHVPMRFSVEVVSAPERKNDVAIVLGYGDVADAPSADTGPKFRALFLPAQGKLLARGWTRSVTLNGTTTLSVDAGARGTESAIRDLVYFADNGDVLFDHDAYFVGAFGGPVGFGYFADKDGGGYRLIDRKGKPVLPEVFERTGEFHDGTVTAREKSGSGWGLIDRTGRVLVPFEYDEVRRFHGEYALVRKGIVTLVRERGGAVHDWSATVDTVRRLERAPGLFAAERGGRWGVVRGDGREILAAVFEREPVAVTPDLFAVARDGRLGLVREQGTLVAPFEYESLDPLAPGLWVLHRNGEPGERLAGLVDSAGKLVVPAQFSAVEKLDDAGRFVRLRERGEPNHEALARSSGEVLTEFGPMSVEPAAAGAWRVQVGARVLLANGDGAIIELPEFTEHAQLLEDGSVLVEVGDTTGFVDRMGVPLGKRYREVQCLEDGSWVATDAGYRRWMLDRRGKELFAFAPDIYPAGLARDKRGTVIVASVLGRNERAVALIDPRTGATLLRFPAGLSRPWVNGIEPDSDAGLVALAGQSGGSYFDLQGKKRLDLPGRTGYAFHGGRAVVALPDNKTGKAMRGVIDLKGKWIVRPEYRWIGDFSESRAWAQRPDGTLHLLDDNGNVLGQVARRCDRDAWLGRDGKVQWPADLAASCRR